MKGDPLPRPRSPRRTFKDSRGFSILEVAMASFVMAFGIATTIIAMQAGYKMIDVARGTTLASQVAQSEMERIRMMSWAAIKALPEKQQADLSTTFTTDPDLASKFTMTRLALDIDDTKDSKTGEATQREITLIVSWRSSTGSSHTRTFTTIYSMNGLYDYYYTLARP